MPRRCCSASTSDVHQNLVHRHVCCGCYMHALSQQCNLLQPYWSCIVWKLLAQTRKSCTTTHQVASQDVSTNEAADGVACAVPAKWSHVSACWSTCCCQSLLLLSIFLVADSHALHGVRAHALHGVRASNNGWHTVHKVVLSMVQHLYVNDNGQGSTYLSPAAQRTPPAQTGL